MFSKKILICKSPKGFLLVEDDIQILWPHLSYVQGQNLSNTKFHCVLPLWLWIIFRNRMKEGWYVFFFKIQDNHVKTSPATVPPVMSYSDVTCIKNTNDFHQFLILVSCKHQTIHSSGTGIFRSLKLHCFWSMVKFGPILFSVLCKIN